MTGAVLHGGAACNEQNQLVMEAAAREQRRSSQSVLARRYRRAVCGKRAISSLRFVGPKAWRLMSALASLSKAQEFAAAAECYKEDLGV